MRRLKVWMRVVGGFYIFLGFINSPLLDVALKQNIYATLDFSRNPSAARVIADLWFMFGLEIAIIGVMLLIGSRAPLRNRILIETVLLLEATRGILMDIYWIARGNYINTLFYVWIVVHLFIIVLGWHFLRHSTATPQREGTQMHPQPT